MNVRKKYTMYSTFIFHRFQMSLFKQSKRIIAETGRMSNVHDESMIIRCKCSTRPTPQAYRRWCRTLLRKKKTTTKTDGQMNSSTKVQWSLYLNKSSEWIGVNKPSGHSVPSTRNIKYVFVNYYLSSIGVNQSKTAVEKKQEIFQYDMKLPVRYLLPSIKLLNK